eukprot:gene31282-37809_t
MKSLKQSARSSAPDLEVVDPMAVDPLTAFSKQAEVSTANNSPSFVPNNLVKENRGDTEALAKISAEKVSPVNKDSYNTGGIGGSTGKFSVAATPKPLSESAARSSAGSSTTISPPRSLAQSASLIPGAPSVPVSVGKATSDYSAASVPLLSGENVIISLLEAQVHLSAYGDLQCVLFMTNYRLLFLPLDTRTKSLYASMLALPSMLQVPLASIDKLERDKKSTALVMLVQCKDCRNLRVTLRGGKNSGGLGGGSAGVGLDYELERAFNVIAAYTFPNDIKHVFAFNHKMPSPQRDASEPPAYKDLVAEYSRLRVLENSYWRVSQSNALFKLCGTYPQVLVTPSAVSDEDLGVVASFRSGGRLPVLCWSSGALRLSNSSSSSGGSQHSIYTAATLWRSSQPKVGKNGSCAQDEKLLDAIARSTLSAHKAVNSKGGYHHSSPTLYIIDCRSRTSAMANYAAGAGYESTSNYPACKLDFYSIPNIHAVRDSYKSLCNIMLNANTSASNDINFSKQIEDTQWLNNIRYILRASWDTAQYLHKGFPVLVHCSHGWDRTAQVCCLAQLLLDPFYRTFEGFPVLVEKEWLAFGHPFQMRCGHGQEKGSDEFSPIFLQFLDCLYQVHRQCCHLFEFNSRYILAIADHIYSCRFSTFLFSCDKDRALYQTQENATDIWVYLNLNKEAFANQLYAPNVSAQATLPALSVLLRGVSLWGDFFLRYASALSVAYLPSHLLPCIDPKRAPPEDKTAAVLSRLLDGSVGLTDNNAALTRRIYSQQDGHEALLAKERRSNAQLRDLLLSVRQSLSQMQVQMQTGPPDDGSNDNAASLEELLRRVDEGLSGAGGDVGLSAVASYSSLPKSASNQVLGQEDGSTPAASGAADKGVVDAAGSVPSEESSPYETGGPVGYDAVESAPDAKEYPDGSSGKYAGLGVPGQGEATYVMCDEPDQLP